MRSSLNHALEEGAGIFRDDSSLQQACDTIRSLKQRFDNVRVTDTSRTFNSELISILELEAMLDVGEAIAHSARSRTESRGSHQRTDHPERDDEHFLNHSLATRTGGDPRIDYRDVVITRWPPGKRTYGTN